VSGLVITKLDGTAKGGAVIQICNNQKYPVRYIGVGEGIEDLQTFSPKEYVEAIFS
ncbi:MAG: signal recognition particle-docking protein FtsY, partial [Ignavibacteriales bacterium]|nr:signal recognition particle-docking protein FtsY [Ignavibacteriales bacterium]